MYDLTEDSRLGAVYIAVGTNGGFRLTSKSCMPLAKETRAYPNPILVVGYSLNNGKLVLGDNRVSCSSLVDLLYHGYFDTPVAFLFNKRPAKITERDVRATADRIAAVLETPVKA